MTRLMSPLQGSIFYLSLRRALPYASECKAFSLLNGMYCYSIKQGEAPT